MLSAVLLLGATGCTGGTGPAELRVGSSPATQVSAAAGALPTTAPPAAPSPTTVPHTAPSPTTAPRTTVPPATASRTTQSPPATPSRTTQSHSTAAPSTTVRLPTTTPPRVTSAAAVPPADVNTPGPDDGPPCAVAPQYSDEPPTGLRPDVLAAWVAVKKYAKSQGVVLCLNDGKRSAAQQLALYHQYVQQFGKAAADSYVLPPTKSAHVKGYAVDVQPAVAYRWLQATSGRYGWCRIYDNEAWHFEYSRDYRITGCPARLPMPVR